MNKAIRTIKNPKLLKLLKLHILGERRQAQGIRAFRKGLLELPYPPVRVRIEVTNKCNLHCVMCPTGCSDDSQRHTGFMDYELYERIIDEVSLFPYPTWLILYLGGEPLLHKDLVRMIELAKAKGLFCRFNTNATLLTDGKAEGILKSGLDAIGFSFDDISPAEYEAMRRGVSYGKTLNNIVNFLRRKKELGMLCPLVTIDSLRLREGGDASRGGEKLRVSSAFRNLFSGYDVQNIVSNWAHLWAGEFAEKSSERKPVVGFPMKCSMPWTDLTINWEGKIVACCFDLKYDYVVGSVREHTLMELWNSEGMVGLRKALFTNDYADVALCRSCSLLLGEI